MNTYSLRMSTTQAPTDTEPDNELGERIQNALIVKNISVRTVSEKTGISYRPLLRSLRGERPLTVYEFANIAQALNISPGDLLPQALTGAAA